MRSDSMDSLSLSLSLSLFIQSYRPSPFISSLAASCVHTEQMNVNFCSLTNTGVSMCSNPSENIAYEFILTSPTFPIMSSSSYSNGL